MNTYFKIEIGLHLQSERFLDIKYNITILINSGLEFVIIDFSPLLLLEWKTTEYEFLIIQFKPRLNEIMNLNFKIMIKVNLKTCFFSYAIYFRCGIPPCFFGLYHRLIFLMAHNGILLPD